MTAAEMLDCLRGLATEAGLAVRVAPARRGAEADAPVRSGVCRVHGHLLVLLADADSLEDRIEALVEGLRRAGPGAWQERWIPPAVRDRLDGPAGG